MLHGREGLKKELEIKSIVTSVLGLDNCSRAENPFPPRKGSDGETVIGVPPGVWTNTIKGRKSPDTFGIGQIQVDQTVVLSDI